MTHGSNERDERAERSERAERGEGGEGGEIRDYSPKPQKTSMSFGKLALFVGVPLGILLAVGVVPRYFNNKDLNETEIKNAKALPVVQTVIAEPADKRENILLPGNIEAIQSASINARASGYLKDRNVDIGDKVKAGQILATIETPETDEEVQQAIADVKEAQASVASAQAAVKTALANQEDAQANVVRTLANNEYTKVTATRWETLMQHGSVSMQSRDEKARSYDVSVADVAAAKAKERAAASQVIAAKSQVAVASANVAAKQAALKRVQAKQGFQNVIAPFDGVITNRKVDAGALISGGSITQNQELYSLARIDQLRIYINVPQRVARYLTTGLDADVLVPEFPDRKFDAKVAKVSGALDQTSRTLQTEIRLENKDRTLAPGMYAQVKLSGLRQEQWIRVPGTSIVVRPEGQFVIVVKDNKAHYQRVVLGRDFGREMEIKQGLSGGEVIAVSPPTDVRDGEDVAAQPAMPDSQ